MALSKTWEEEQVPPGGGVGSLLGGDPPRAVLWGDSSAAFWRLQVERVCGTWWLLREANGEQVGRAWKTKLKA